MVVGLTIVHVYNVGAAEPAVTRSVADTWGEGTASHALFTSILHNHVHQARVDYQALKSDDRLTRYLAQLAATDPDTISDRNDRLAFWLNAYNAYTLKVVADSYPIDSINDLHFGGLVIGIVLNKTVWDREFVEIGGETLTLDRIEHDIVRPEFRDPRIHFALVCAARSCPPLRSEAYEGFKLDTQLDDQGRTFFAQRARNWFDSEGKIAHLSKILDWYADDFGASDAEILLYVARFVPEELAAAIRAEPEAWRIKHTKYFWELNE